MVHHGYFHVTTAQLRKMENGFPIHGLPAHEGNHLKKKHHLVRVHLTGEGMKKLLSLQRRHAKTSSMGKMYLHHLPHPKAKVVHMAGKGWFDWLGNAASSVGNALGNAVSFVRERVAPVVQTGANIVQGIASQIPDPRLQRAAEIARQVGGIAGSIRPPEPPQQQVVDRLEERNEVAPVQMPNLPIPPAYIPTPTPIEQIAVRPPTVQPTVEYRAPRKLPVRKVHPKPKAKILASKVVKKKAIKKIKGRGLPDVLESEDVSEAVKALPEIVTTHPNLIQASKIGVAASHHRRHRVHAF